jgi:hypothetical protein
LCIFLPSRRIFKASKGKSGHPKHQPSIAMPMTIYDYHKSF